MDVENTFEIHKNVDKVFEEMSEMKLFSTHIQ